MFFKIDVLKNFAIFTGKRLCKSFFNKVAGLQASNFIKKRLQHRCFLVKFTKFLKLVFFLIFCVSKQIRAENEGTHPHRHGPTQWCCGSFWRSQRWGWNNLWKRFLIDILIRKQLNNQYFGRSFSNSGLIFEYKNKLRVGLYRTAQCKLIFHF